MPRWLFLLAVLLSGCMEPDIDQPAADKPSASQSQSSTGTTGSIVAPHDGFAGLQLTGSLRSNDPFRAEMWANNTGTSTYKVYIGGTPAHLWSDSMRNETAAVHHRPSLGTGGGYTIEDFGPGSSKAVHLSWNGTLQHPQDAQRMVPAPPGRYFWTVAFQAWFPDDQGEQGIRSMTFDLLIP